MKTITSASSVALVALFVVAMAGFCLGAENSLNSEYSSLMRNQQRYYRRYGGRGGYRNSMRR